MVCVSYFRGMNECSGWVSESDLGRLHALERVGGSYFSSKAKSHKPQYITGQ